MSFDFDRLVREERRFDERVSAAMDDSDELSAYVQQLEQVVDDSGAPPAPSELPPAEGIIEDLEAFLRRTRGDES